MKSEQVLKVFETLIHQHFLEVLEVSPVESLTPFRMEDSRNGKEEFIFVAKCTPAIYAPVKNRDVMMQTPIDISVYIEGTSLIIRFDFLSIVLESEITQAMIPSFLSTMMQSNKTTLAIVDANSYKLVWVTNTIDTTGLMDIAQELLKKLNIH